MATDKQRAVLQELAEIRAAESALEARKLDALIRARSAGCGLAETAAAIGVAPRTLRRIERDAGLPERARFGQGTESD